MSPGELAGRISALPLEIDELAVERRELSLEGYYDPVRPVGVAVLGGRGERGVGECVAWTPPEQDAFAAACGRLALPPRSTVGEVSDLLAEELDDPYHRAAVEASAIDLALRQARTNLFAIAGRAPRPVAFCRSIGRADDPRAAIAAVLEREPAARIKIDVPAEGWPAAIWEALAREGRVVVVDLKRESEVDQVRLAHAALPEAWLEDPPAEAVTLDPGGGWTARVALDGYVLAASDLDDPEIPPAAVNVKAPRLAGWIEALRCLEECRRRELHAYFGGMFEVDAGRRQGRVLASLFTADAWNDLAPIAGANSAETLSPLAQAADFSGFAPDSDADAA